jgi:Kef-type K+ transport system membrane component KefB
MAEMDFAVAGFRLSDIPEGIEPLHFAVQLALLFTTARALGGIAVRLGQPSVIGELLAGILLGPSILGALLPRGYHLVVASGDSEFGPGLEAFCSFAVVLILASAGLELDLGSVRRARSVVASTAACGLLVPFAAGASLGYVLAGIPGMNGVPEKPLVFIVFTATMLSISAVPVLVKILLDLGLLRTGIGATILSAAVAMDVVAWILVACASGLIDGSADIWSVGSLAATVIVFLTLTCLLGRKLVGALASLARRSGVRHWRVAVCLMISFGLAEITQLIGMHAVLGAFVGGMLVKESFGPDVRELWVLRSAVTKFVGPAFFAVFGLKVNLSLLSDPTLLLIGLTVTLVACASKVAGGTLGARLGGLPFWRAAAVGSGINARGSVEVIVAALALSLGVVTQQFYSIIVLMAVATSVMTPTLLKWTLARSEQASSFAESGFVLPGKDDGVSNRPHEITASSLDEVKH